MQVTYLSEGLAHNILGETVHKGGYTYTHSPHRYSVGTGKGFTVPVSELVTEDIYRVLLMAQTTDADGFGTWVHEGLVYLDCIKLFTNLPDALSFAKEHNELAIYDRAAEEEIKVHY